MPVDLETTEAKLNSVFQLQGLQMLAQPERLQAWLMDIEPDNWPLLLDIARLYGNPLKQQSDSEHLLSELTNRYEQASAFYDLWRRLKWLDFPERTIPPNQTLLDDALYQRIMEKMHAEGDFRWV